MPELIVSGHQPRLQPRRRHHLLRHRRRRARGHRARHPGDRRRRSRPTTARWTSAPAAPGRRSDFEQGAAFVARIVEELERVPMPEGTLLNINCPAGGAEGRAACRLGKRIYRDRLELAEEEERPPPLPHLRRRPELPRRGRHRLRGDRRRPDRRHPAALRPHRPGGRRGARRLRPRPAAAAGRPARFEHRPRSRAGGRAAPAARAPRPPLLRPRRPRDLATTSTTRC